MRAAVQVEAPDARAGRGRAAELAQRAVDRLGHEVQRHVVDRVERRFAHGPRGRHAGVDTQRCPNAIPSSGNCSGMWSSWCHSLYAWCSPGSVISVNEKNPTLTLFNASLSPRAGSVPAAVGQSPEFVTEYVDLRDLLCAHVPARGGRVGTHLLGLRRPRSRTRRPAATSSQPNARSSNVWPWSRAHASSASTRSKFRSESACSPASAGIVGEPRPCGRRLAPLVLAGQHAAREREVRDERDVVNFAHASSTPCCSGPRCSRLYSFCTLTKRATRARALIASALLDHLGGEVAASRSRAPCPRARARRARRASRRAASPGRGSAAGTGRCDRCRAGAASLRTHA